MKCIDNRIRVDEGVSVLTGRISLSLFAHNCALLASFEEDLQYALVSFLHACDQTGMKLSIATSMIILFSSKPG